jgi:hypothetical protein
MVLMANNAKCRKSYWIVMIRVFKKLRPTYPARKFRNFALRKYNPVWTVLRRLSGADDLFAVTAGGIHLVAVFAGARGIGGCAYLIRST